MAILGGATPRVESVKRSPLQSSAPVSFGPVPGGVSGWIGLAVVAVVLVTLPFGGLTHGEVVTGIALVLIGLLIWTLMLRPRVVLQDDAVELRNFVRSRFIPYGLVDDVWVKTVTLVEAGGRRYVGAGVGRKVKQIVRATVPKRVPDPEPAPGRLTNDTLPDYMCQRIRERAVAAPKGEGVVRTSWALPEIAGFVVLVVALVVSALV